MKKQDEPAFPINIPGHGDNGLSGLTKRELFAAMAMQGMLANNTKVTSGDDMEYAVCYADDLLKALESSDEK